MSKIFFDNWDGLARTALIGPMAYGCLIFMLRISGSRTLSKMNAFDLIVTVALGSTLATILLNKDVALAEGALALALLIGLQFIITWTSVRVSWVRKLVTGEPALLYYRGKFLDHALRQQRVTVNEVHAAIRDAGLPTQAIAEAVVLETDGTISVMPRSDEGSPDLMGVRNDGGVTRET